METIVKYFPDLTENQKRQISVFHDLFLDWNTKVNLISRKDTEHFYERHILHSLAIAKFISFKPGSSVMDVGTGGGLPGIPLAIVFPDTKFLLIDSIGKKIRAVQDMAGKLELSNLKATHDRCENIPESFDFIVSRAVAPTGKIHGWVKNKLKKANNNSIRNGYILLKGGDLSGEIEESKLSNVSQIPISDYYSEEFFETKKIVCVTF